MGLANCTVSLRNPQYPDQEVFESEALADTGSVYLIIPEHVRLQLLLEFKDRKEVTLADGSKQIVPYVGPIELKFKNRSAYVGAIVMGNEVHLGAIPMEDMDLVVFHQEPRVDINPLDPNFAAASAKATSPHSGWRMNDE
ncbi:MAG: clan AA aspartic protease [Puniceicoccaceae bacterium]